MSCEALQKIVDQETTALAEVKQAPAGSEAQLHGEAMIKALTDSARAALSQVEAVPEGTMAAVSGEVRATFLEAIVGLQKAAITETRAALAGDAEAFGDGTFLRLFLEYLPMLLELLKQFL